MAAHLVWDAQRGAPEIQAGARSGCSTPVPASRWQPRANCGCTPVRPVPRWPQPDGRGAAGSGHTTVWTCGEQRPTASTNNFVVGETTPNFAVVRTDAAGDFCVYSTAQTHLLWDQAGRRPDSKRAARCGCSTRWRRVPAGATIRVAAGVPNATVVGNLTVASAQTAGHTWRSPAMHRPGDLGQRLHGRRDHRQLRGDPHGRGRGVLRVHRGYREVGLGPGRGHARHPGRRAGAAVDTRTGGGPVTAGRCAGSRPGRSGAPCSAV